MSFLDQGPEAVSSTRCRPVHSGEGGEAHATSALAIASSLLVPRSSALASSVLHSATATIDFAFDLRRLEISSHLRGHLEAGPSAARIEHLLGPALVRQPP
jgi:hypothetical protein